MADAKSNITLIGMPGAGKSTIGVILAKRLALGFVDTDVLIQTSRGESLQNLLERRGHLGLRRIEEEEILRLDVRRHVIATGGSAAYSDRAMRHLAAGSRIVFLKVAYADLLARIHDFESRGIAKAPNQSFAELFAERQVLYERWAEITVDCAGLNQDAVAGRIAAALSSR